MSQLHPPPIYAYYRGTGLLDILHLNCANQICKSCKIVPSFNCLPFVLPIYWLQIRRFEQIVDLKIEKWTLLHTNTLGRYGVMIR